MKITHVMVLVVFAVGSIDCGGSAPTGLSSPTAVFPVNPSASTLVYGYVADTLLRPLAGVTVEVLDGPQAGAVLTSGLTGQFQANGPFDDATRFRASKPGFVTATATLAPKCALCNGRSLTIFLAVAAVPVSVAGDYTLTLAADAACTDLPGDVRSRTFETTIVPTAIRNGPADSVLRGTVSGDSFLPYLNGFDVGVAGNDVGFEFRGEGPSLVEKLGANRYIAFEGRADTQVGAAGVSTITATFNGAIEYCELKGDMGAYYICAQTIAFTRCVSTNHHLVLTRR
jgi:hypothetical protein